MKLSIANYNNKSNKGHGKSNLVIHCNDLGWVEEHFGDRLVTGTITHEQIRLRVDPHGKNRWGKVTKGRRQISIFHDTDLRLFGATYIPINHINLDAFNDGSGDCIIMIPSEEELVTPIKRIKPKGKQIPKISLREAVEAVNAHKMQFGSDLCLSIDPKGELRALIEY